MLKRLLEGLRGWLASPRVTVGVVALAVLLSLPSITTGMAADDYWHKLALTGGHAEVALVQNHWWKLFTFFDGDPERMRSFIDRGIAPWWSDLSTRVSFFRPLSSLTHVVDYALWPNSPPIMHLHSVAWYAALVAVASWVYRRLLAPEGRAASGGFVAGLAALLYAIDYAHGIPIGWLSNRNALVSATFALASLGAHDAAVANEAGRGRRWTGLSAVLLACGLASGEAALAIAAYLASHAWFVDTRSRRARFASLVPHAAVIAAWAVVYRVLGFGVSGSGMYFEPLREPVVYVLAVLQHLPLLIATELGVPAAELYPFLQAPLKAAVLTAALAFCAWSSVALVRLCRVSDRARFLVAGSVISVLPACATLPSPRLLTIPGFGLLGLVALVGAGVYEGAAWLPGGRWARRATRAFAIWTCGVHLVLSPLAMAPSTCQVMFFNRLVERYATGIPSRPPLADRVVLINAPDSLFIAFMFAATKTEGRPGPDRILSLAAGARRMVVTRPADRVLVVEQDNGLYRIGTEMLTRKRASPMPVGTKLVLTGVTIEVLAIEPDGVPNKVAFTFADALDGPTLDFRAWKGQAIVPFTLPAIGESITIDGQVIAPF